MADEVLGNVYEVLTIVAIEDYTTILKKEESVFWHEHPKGVLIEPDLTIGKDKDHPRLLLQVSHTNAERASEKKFWRNIGEFVDARLALGSSTAISNVVFDSGQKRRLAAGSEALFDGFLEADRTTYGKDLIKLGNRLVSVVGKSKASWTDRADLIRNYLKTSAASVVTVRAFAMDVEKMVSTSSKFAGSWFGAYQLFQNKRLQPRLPSRKVTSLRRGLGRLLPISDEKVLRVLVDSARSRSAVTTPQYLRDLALVRPSIKGLCIADSEILLMADQFSTATIVELWRLAKRTSESLRQACGSIEQFGDFSLFHDFIVTRYAELIKSSRMKTALCDCFADPDLILGDKIGLSAPDGYGLWLFDYLMTLIKAYSGKQQGYGYTSLGADTGYQAFAAHPGLVLSPFIQRKKMLSAAMLDGVSSVFAGHLKRIGSKWIGGSKTKVAEFFLRGLFVDKIYKIAAFDPLYELLFKELTAGKSGATPTFLSALTGNKSATCQAFKASNTLVLWQSASDKGVGHKMKELCGRIGMLRVTTNASGAAVPDARYKKAILLIDGTWTAEHIQRLVDAGFDEVYYPDEVDKLIAAIV